MNFSSNYNQNLKQCLYIRWKRSKIFSRENRWKFGLARMNKTYKFDNLVNISKQQVVRDIAGITNPIQLVCKHCQHGIQTRVSFKTKEYTTKNPPELVHMDLCGPTRTKGLNGEYYFMLFMMTSHEWHGFYSSRKNQKLLNALNPLEICREWK